MVFIFLRSPDDGRCPPSGTTSTDSCFGNVAGLSFLVMWVVSFVLASKIVPPLSWHVWFWVLVQPVSIWSNRNNLKSPTNESDYLVAFLNIAKNGGKEVLVTDYCSVKTDQLSAGFKLYFDLSLLL